MRKKNIIIDLSFEFVLKILEYSEQLEERRKYVVANQLLRSGTSIGASVREAQNGESVADFIHKMKLAAKEAEETCYWLELCNKSNNYPKPNNLLIDLEHIQKVLSKIISSSKKNKLSNYPINKSPN